MNPVRHLMYLKSETCDKRPLQRETDLWRETTLAVKWPYISVHLYLQWKTICHIRLLSLVLYGGLSSQVSLYILWYDILTLYLVCIIRKDLTLLLCADFKSQKTWILGYYQNLKNKTKYICIVVLFCSIGYVLF